MQARRQAGSKEKLHVPTLYMISPLDRTSSTLLQSTLSHVRIKDILPLYHIGNIGQIDNMAIIKNPFRKQDENVRPAPTPLANDKPTSSSSSTKQFDVDTKKPVEYKLSGESGCAWLRSMDLNR